MKTKEEFLALMCFPTEWLAWDMIPKELADIQLRHYEVGHENASEHDRNGAFHWWLKKAPPASSEELVKLVQLSFIDPDQVMASDVRKYITSSPNCNDQVIKALNHKNDKNS